MAKSEEKIFDTNLTTKKLFVEHDFCWWLLGQKPTEKFKVLYYIYSFILNGFFLIGFPMHLMFGLLQFKTPADIFDNLAINFTCTLATVKSYIIWWNFDKIEEIKKIMEKLDNRVTELSDVRYYVDTVFPAARHVAHLFYVLCIGMGTTSEFSVLCAGIFGKDWRLLYPAYFFFDPYGSTLNYTIAHLYEYVSLCGHIFQNFVNDTYGGMCLAIVCGHTRLLGRRIARIGWDESKTLEQNNEELLECIQDHKILMAYHEKLMQIVSIPLLLQVFFAAVNMCLVIVQVVFFDPDIFTIMYCTCYFIGLSMEIYPCCYYGSKMEFEFFNLTRVIFECNWMDQNEVFKKNFRFLGQFTLRTVAIDSGGILRVNLTAFIGTCKMAYSLFTMLSHMK